MSCFKNALQYFKLKYFKKLSDSNLKKYLKNNYSFRKFLFYFIFILIINITNFVFLYSFNQNDQLKSSENITKIIKDKKSLRILFNDQIFIDLKEEKFSKKIFHKKKINFLSYNSNFRLVQTNSSIINLPENLSNIVMLEAGMILIQTLLLISFISIRIVNIKFKYLLFKFISFFCGLNHFLQFQVLKIILNKIKDNSFHSLFTIPYSHAALTIFYSLYIDSDYLINIFSSLISGILIYCFSIGYEWNKDYYFFIYITFIAAYCYFTFLIEINKRNIFLVEENNDINLKNTMNILENLNSGFLVYRKDFSFQSNRKYNEIFNINLEGNSNEFEQNYNRFILFTHLTDFNTSFLTESFIKNIKNYNSIFLEYEQNFNDLQISTEKLKKFDESKKLENFQTKIIENSSNINNFENNSQIIESNNYQVVENGENKLKVINLINQIQNNDEKNKNFLADGSTQNLFNQTPNFSFNGLDLINNKNKTQENNDSTIKKNTIFFKETIKNNINQLNETNANQNDNSNKFKTNVLELSSNTKNFKRTASKINRSNNSLYIKINEDNVKNIKLDEYNLLKDKIENLKENLKCLNSDLEKFTKYLFENTKSSKYEYLATKNLNKDSDQYVYRIYFRYNDLSDTLEFLIDDLSSIIKITDIKSQFKYKKYFLDKFSHEFRNPILNIKQLVKNVKSMYSNFKKQIVSDVKINNAIKVSENPTMKSVDKNTITPIPTPSVLKLQSPEKNFVNNNRGNFNFNKNDCRIEKNIDIIEFPININKNDNTEITIIPTDLVKNNKYKDTNIEIIQFPTNDRINNFKETSSVKNTNLSVKNNLLVAKKTKNSNNFAESFIINSSDFKNNIEHQNNLTINNINLNVNNSEEINSDLKHIKNLCEYMSLLISDFDFVSNSTNISLSRNHFSKTYSSNNLINENNSLIKNISNIKSPSENKYPNINSNSNIPQAASSNNLNKIYRNDTSVEKTSFDIFKFIRYFIKIFQSKIILSDKKIELNYSINQKVPQKINHDVNKIKLIIFNLLCNSVKFTTNGNIKIEVDADNQNLFFIISDSGIGIKSDNLIKLLQPIDMINLVDNNAGMGMGLFIVRRYLEVLNGNLNIASEYGLGTLIKLKIPFQISRIESTYTLLVNEKLALDQYPNIRKETMRSNLTRNYTMQIKKPQKYKSYKPRIDTQIKKKFEINSNQYDKTLTGYKEMNGKELNQNKIISSNTDLYNSGFYRPNMNEDLKNTNVISSPGSVKSKIKENKTVVMSENHFRYNYRDIMSIDSEGSQSNSEVNSNLCDDPLNNYNLKKKTTSIISLNNKNSSNFYNINLPNSEKKNTKISIKNLNNFVSFNNSLKILIVDDEKLIRQSERNVMNKYFKEKGISYEIEECSDGVECLYMIYDGMKNGKKYDIIITDENMNFMNGSTFSEILKKLMNDNIMYFLKIVMITSYEISNISNNVKKNVDKIFTKPLSYNTLELIFT